MKPNFNAGLLPCIVQDASTGQVLMLGYMNEEAWNKTISEQRVTFYSRSKKRLWTKGETSGNFIDVVHVLTDCDNDTILVQGNSSGPTCHLGAISCFTGSAKFGLDFLQELEGVIRSRISTAQPRSYVSRLSSAGIKRIAQKVSEEASELIIEALGDDQERLTAEAADLIFHILVLLAYKKLDLAAVINELKKRYKEQLKLGQEE